MINGHRQAGRAAAPHVLPYKLLGRPRLHHNLLSAEGMWEEGSQEWVSAVLAVMQDRALHTVMASSVFSADWGSN